jgi:hypothetical protein
MRGVRGGALAGAAPREGRAPAGRHRGLRGFPRWRPPSSLESATKLGRFAGGWLRRRLLWGATELGEVQKPCKSAVLHLYARWASPSPKPIFGGAVSYPA